MVAALSSLAAALGAGLHPKTLLLGAVAFLFFAYFLKTRRPKNYPPGPWRLPFLGNLFTLDMEKSHLQLQQFVKKYGNLFCLDLAGKSIVIVTGLPLIKEVLVHMDQNFINRPVPPIRERSFKKNAKRPRSDL